MNTAFTAQTRRVFATLTSDFDAVHESNDNLSIWLAKQSLRPHCSKTKEYVW